MTVNDERELAERLHAEVTQVDVDAAVVGVAVRHGRRRVLRRRIATAAGVTGGLAVVAGGLLLWADPPGDTADGVVSQPENEVLLMAPPGVPDSLGPGLNVARLMGLQEGTLAVDDRNCLVLESSVGELLAVVWPAGSTAARDAEGRAVLYDHNGAVVAREGQGISLGGGVGGSIDPEHPCAADHVWSANPGISLTPGTDPGPGGRDVTLSIIEPMLAARPEFDAGFRQWSRQGAAVIVGIVDSVDPAAAQAFQNELKQALAADEAASKLWFRSAVAPEAELQALADEFMDTTSEWASDPAGVQEIISMPVEGLLTILVDGPEVAPGLDGTTRTLPSGAVVTIDVMS
ncbi:hypothetical protein [Jiangella mangrovi]|uniref:Uncharacterized protein n=1 Tax=Jiangella mangrovi TaxID=1524084 RepID=A0A7W9LQ51_9ACTN|nr:hypothetical protein [Jiangella mangrovi]MBB5791924.1 hypothetical protein [Jiangella mangrovi]